MPPSTSFSVAPSVSSRKRVLVVNCYIDYSREPIRRPTKFPQAVGPIFLAGAFARDRCEVRCYDELASGPLEDELTMTRSGPLRIEAVRFVDPEAFQIDSYHPPRLK